jgi:hypothetical protein
MLDNWSPDLFKVEVPLDEHVESTNLAGRVHLNWSNENRPFLVMVLGASGLLTFCEVDGSLELKLPDFWGPLSLHLTAQLVLRWPLFVESDTICEFFSNGICSFKSSLASSVIVLDSPFFKSKAFCSVLQLFWIANLNNFGEEVVLEGVLSLIILELFKVMGLQLFSGIVLGMCSYKAAIVS